MGREERIIRTYFGGKAASGTYQKIINQIRPHDCYIEPFLGGGSILLSKKPAHISIGVEIDPAIYAKWNSKLRHLTIPCLTIQHGDAFEFLRNFNYSQYGRVCVYLDPPYPHDSRKSKHRYAHELTDEEHRELLLLIQTLPQNVDVLISTYPNLMYAEALLNWHCIRFQSQTRKGLAWEMLYMNYHSVDDLHDTSYAGQDYRDRERIKKKVVRWVEKYRQMPSEERSAIFQALCQIENVDQNTVPLTSTDKNTDVCSDISPKQLNLFV